MKKIVGILGGMGPKATVYLFDLLVRFTQAEKDSDHIPIIIFNNPQIPDRTAAILGNGPSPLSLLIEGAKFLERSGAAFIIMPCVTAHYFYPEILKNINIPFLHIIEETALYLERKHPEWRKLGLLSTTGTIETHIFQDILEKTGKEIIIPDNKDQKDIMHAVYGEDGVKAGFTEQPKKIILDVISNLMKNKGCQAVIAGCTEIPLTLEQKDSVLPVIEPLEIIAVSSIKRAGYRLASSK